jgi:hypothetical protein
MGGHHAKPYVYVTAKNHFLTRNTRMQQPLAYSFQTVFQHEVFVITPTLNAGSRCSRHISHGNTIIVFLYKTGKK